MLKLPGDDVARSLVMGRSLGSCERCHAAPATEWHHVLSRGYPSIRHDPANGVGLCHKCHDYAGANGANFRAWWAGVIGEGEWLRLRSAFTTKEWGGKNADGNRKAWVAQPSLAKNCVACGAEFRSRSRGSTTKWCSKACGYAWLKRDPLRGKSITLAGSIRLGKHKREVVGEMLTAALDRPCSYCGRIVTLDNASIDHKTPRRGLARTGGAVSRHLDRRENLHVVCRKCNLAKGAMSHEAFLRLLAFLRGDPELYAAVLPRLGMAGMGWKNIKARRSSG